ncbi:hypothetical protein LTR73_000603 [Friedmanniomyces endolithicus]|nr:hypothetical protein LTR73_000603 [Friedmanniomyces endolithicus]
MSAEHDRHIQTSMPLIRYSRCSTDELKTFAIARNIQVSPPHAFRHRRPSRADHINALKQADKDFRFRFLDLAPELRNRIYRELLLFHDSYSCRPRILATCKTIHSEAGAILYRDNLIEIKLRRGATDGYWDSMVIAHGKDCGRLSMFGSADDLTAYQWPDFLLRAQWIRVSTTFESMLSNAKDVRQQPVANRDKQDINYALYSLCSFLQDKHCLVAIEVDVGTNMSTILADPGPGTDEEVAHGVLSPLQLLGPLSLFHIINSDGSVTQLTQSSFPVHARLQGGVLGPLQSMLYEFDACHTLLPFSQSSVELHGPLHRPLITQAVRGFDAHAYRMAVSQNELKMTTVLCTSDFESKCSVINCDLRSHMDEWNLDVLEEALTLKILGPQMASVKNILEQWRSCRGRRKELEEAGDGLAA